VTFERRRERRDTKGDPHHGRGRRAEKKREDPVKRA
jgi:hypothetical protein